MDYLDDWFLRDVDLPPMAKMIVIKTPQGINVPNPMLDLYKKREVGGHRFSDIILDDFTKEFLAVPEESTDD